MMAGWEPMAETRLILELLKEIQAYYRQDAWIWRFYLAFRRIDRYLHRLLGKDYPYVLPGKTKR